MDHSEAVEQMAAERYLLEELPAALRDEFEEHMFDCPECAFDIRAGVAFIDEAKVQLPALTAKREKAAQKVPPKRVEDRADSRGARPWWKTLFATPAFAAPVFATLLLVIGYQNAVTFPALRQEASAPRLLSPVPLLHMDTRNGEVIPVESTRAQGFLLRMEIVDLQDSTAYTVDLYDPRGKLAWTRIFSASELFGPGGYDGRLSVGVPGAGLEQGSYTLQVSAAGSSGERKDVGRKVLAIHLND